MPAAAPWGWRRSGSGPGETRGALGRRVWAPVLAAGDSAPVPGCGTAGSALTFVSGRRQRLRGGTVWPGVTAGPGCAELRGVGLGRGAAGRGCPRFAPAVGDKAGDNR